MNTALYLRVSTDQQSDRFGLESQRAACKTYADRHGLQITREYVDIYTGTAEVRAALTELLTEAHQYQHVLTYSVDRIARTVPAAYSIVQQLQQLNLTVHTTLDGVVNLEDDSDALRFGVNAIFADMERRKITTRTHAGRVARAAAGKLPNGTTAYGYQTDKNTDQVCIVEAEAQIIKRIFELSKTQSANLIASTLNNEGHRTRNGGLWWATVITRIVRNSLYKGEYVYGKQKARRTKTPVTVAVPAIVDPVTWQLAQRTGIRGTKRNTHDFLLKGRCTCGVCGHTYLAKRTRITRPNGKLYEIWHYRCSSSHSPTGTCGNPGRKKDLLEQAVIQDLREKLADPHEFQKVFLQPTEKTVDLTPLEERDQSALKAFKLGALTPEEFAEIRSEIQAEKTKLLGQTEDRNLDTHEVLRTIEHMTDREIIQYLGVHVVIHPDGIELRKGD